MLTVDDWRVSSKALATDGLTVDVRRWTADGGRKIIDLAILRCSGQELTYCKRILNTFMNMAKAKGERIITIPLPNSDLVLHSFNSSLSMAFAVILTTWTGRFPCARNCFWPDVFLYQESQRGDKSNTDQYFLKTHFLIKDLICYQSYKVRKNGHKPQLQ